MDMKQTKSTFTDEDAKWKNCTKTANSRGKSSSSLRVNKLVLRSPSVTQTKIKVDQGYLN